MSKHTPGPWTVGRNGFNANQVTVGEEDSICEVYGIPLHTRVDEVSERWSTGLANAHLIAAAPEMYEALKAALEDVAEIEAVAGVEAPSRKKLWAALAKAEGRP